MTWDSSITKATKRLRKWQLEYFKASRKQLFKTLSQPVVSYYISIQFFWCKYRGEYLPPFKTKPTIMGVQKGQNYEHTQLSTMLVNTMKAHTCNTKRSQKTFEPRANKPNLSHPSRNVSHTIRISHTQVEMSHTKKSNFLRGGFGKVVC
jgi:hypothetical protein